MTEHEQLETFKQALANVTKRPAPDITKDTLLTTLSIDSLDAVEMQMYYEDTFGIETKDPSGAIKTVGDFLNLLQ